jgi:hypothetical protein
VAAEPGSGAGCAGMYRPARRSSAFEEVTRMYYNLKKIRIKA